MTLDYDGIAAALERQHANRERFHTLVGLSRIDEAYAIQRAYVARLRAAGLGDVAGYKIGLTSKPMQKMCGINHPVAGVVLTHRVHSSPTMLQCKDYGRLGIESELCLIAGSDIEAGLSEQEVRARLSAICAAFEIVDDRGADYRTLHALSLVADNSWNAGVVLGQPAAVSLLSPNLSGALSINGVDVDRGTAADILDGPIGAVQWLCSHLAATGEKLRAGQFVMTGSIVTTKFVEPGSELQFHLDVLPSVGVSIQA